MEKISVVAPIYNEEDNLFPLHKRLGKTLQGMKGFDYEILLVNDGSTDKTQEMIEELTEKDPRVRYIKLSRNFGHEAAISAGLDNAVGDCVVIIDADLQDPPEVIPKLGEKWKEGYDVVYAQRKNRPGESIFKKTTSYLFYRIINLISQHKMPVDTGDFRLMDRKVVEAFKQMGDYNRMVRGMIAWLGFNQICVQYDREERNAGKTKYGLFKLIWLSFDAMTSFSIIPLRISAWMGFFITFVSMILALAVLYDRVWGNLKMPGYALNTVGMFFLGGVQLTILGIIGEYLGKTYQQTLRRPLYVIADESNGKAEDGRQTD